MNMSLFSFFHARPSRILLLPMVALCVGCAAAGGNQRGDQNQSRGSFARDGERVTLEELGQLTTGFADRYMNHIVAACTEIEKDNPSQEQRRLSHQVKLVQVSSAYDIVTNADPFTQLLDLVLVVTLQSQKWIDEDIAEEWFGDRAGPLIAASRKTREDIWRIAARAMKPEQLEVLDYLIWDWRRKNEDVQVVSFVRFDDFAGSRGKSVVADVKTGTGLLAPVDEAKKAVDEVRLLSERGFYYAKRMPFLMNWQIETAIDDATANPQIKGVTDSVGSVSTSVDRVTAVVEALPNEITRQRQAILRDVQRMDPMIRTAFTQYRGAIGDTGELVQQVHGVTESVDSLLQTLQTTTQTLNTTMTTVDKVFMEPGRKQPKPKDEKPFDIESYARTAVALTAALKEANQLMGSAGTMLGGPTMDKPMQQINAIAQERVEQATSSGARIINVAFWRGAALIVLFFVCLILYKIFAVKILGDRSGKARA
jgi:hypothetical protein